MMAMARKLALALAALGVSLAAASCGKKPPPQMPPPVVEVMPVVQKDVPVYKEAIGTLDGYVNAEIRPQVNGYLLRMAYKEGSLVRSGDLLYLIDPRQFQAGFDQAKGDLARAQAALENARQTVARYRPLAAQNAVSQQELDNAVATERQAQASVESARAAVETARNNLNWTSVTSPITGIAGKSTAQLGDLVTPQTVLTTVSQVDPIKLIFPISEQSYMRYASLIEGGAAPPIQLILSDGSVHPQPGKLLFANRQVDVKTGTITLEAAFSNPGNLLRPGQYGKARGATDLLKGAILVPQRAVIELQGSFMVAVVGPDNKVEMRPIQRGQPVDESFVVEKGLKAGERIVVEGVQKVRPGIAVDPKPATAGKTSPTPPAPAPGA
jgi:membrane fusion protein (multidrug efflux system)